jgi:hypothetical protein
MKRILPSPQFASLVLSLALSAASLPAQVAPPATSSEVTIRLELIEAESTATYLREAQTPFEGLVRELDGKYDIALERALESSNRAGLLEESVALRDERKRVADGPGVPATDATGDPELLRQLRTTYRAERRKLEAERDLAAAPLLAAHETKLEAYQKQLTTEGKLDEALIVKAARENAAARIRDRLAPKPVVAEPAATAPTPPPVMTATPPVAPAPETPPAVAATPEDEFLQWLGTVQLEHAGGQLWAVSHREFLEYNKNHKRPMRVSSIVIDPVVDGFTMILHDKRPRLIAFEKGRREYRISVDGGATFDPPIHQVKKRDERLFGPPPSPPAVPSDFEAWVRTRQFVHGIGKSVIWSIEGHESVVYSVARKELFRFPVLRVDPKNREFAWRLASGREESIQISENYEWFDVVEQPGAEPIPQPLPIEARDPAIFGETPNRESAAVN